MKKNQKAILGILLVLFLIIAVLAYVFSGKTKETEKPNNSTEEEKKDRFGLVDDYEEFFSIQSSINDIENVEMDTSYFVQEIYINTISNTYYYFIRITKFAEFDDPVDKYLLLILDKNTDHYELNEINDIISDLESYAKNYNIKEKSINSGSMLMRGNGSTKNILTVYLEYFKILLIKDSQAAYNMLADDTKAKYIDYNDFDSNVINIYESLSSGIFSIGSDDTKNDDIKIYSFEDNNRNKITIYEESIMNFKISY